ncbi:MAG: sulfur carrier protein ThiS [Bacteroidales bacterium]|nr:sulfur carrier protein ThiS [Bacteroidales bacterium]
MNIFVNQKPLVTAAQTVADLAVELDLPQQGVAVAMNQKLVLRDSWATTLLVEGCSIVIILAACGG